MFVNTQSLNNIVKITKEYVRKRLMDQVFFIYPFDINFIP